MSDRTLCLSHLNLPRPLTIQKPLRDIDNRIECTNRDREAHRTAKDNNIIGPSPLLRLLIISPAEVIGQLLHLRGA